MTAEEARRRWDEQQVEWQRTLADLQQRKGAVDRAVDRQLTSAGQLPVLYCYCDFPLVLGRDLVQ